MPPTKHALLSASSAHRWMICTPSARACENIEERASPYAKQGTDAHALCEYKLKKALGMKAEDPTKDLKYFDWVMDASSDAYCAFVLEQLDAVKKICDYPIAMIEQQLDFSRWVPEGFGTGDAVIVADHVLHIIDFKYGLGVLVEAENNPQLRCYALGALDGYGSVYNISAIKMSIFQPRRANIRTVEMSKTKLLSWAEGILAPKAQLAFNGEGEFKAGDHCRFCLLKATCRTRAKYNLELARNDFCEI